MRGPTEIDRKHAKQHAADQRWQNDNAPRGEPRGETGTHGDRNGKDREEEGDDSLGAADVDCREWQQERHDDDADQPEPAHHQRAPPQPRIGSQLLDQRAGGDEDVAVDRKLRRALAGGRDEPARNPAGERGEDHQPGEVDRIAVALGGKTGRDGADQDREKSTAFDQRIAGRELFAGEMVGQDAVFDRPEQRSERAKQKQRDKKKNKRVERKPRNREHGNADLHELDALRHPGFVVAVGELTAEPRQKEVRRDEDRGSELNQNSGIGAGDMEQDQEAEGGLEEIVAERGEELAQEQRRKAARRHQGREHGSPAAAFSPACRRLSASV